MEFCHSDRKVVTKATGMYEYFLQTSFRNLLIFLCSVQESPSQFTSFSKYHIPNPR